ncbi:MAG: hypothetical protein CMM52_08260 [Rhodospirillaceae bacterium]|nr:hypothetical protein [Rhodospirillaceae bacterium]|tara:strand:- start:2996 stop:3538 length:543 start_codon:yes stop_codon:yes gene_type:complete
MKPFFKFLRRGILVLGTAVCLSGCTSFSSYFAKEGDLNAGDSAAKQEILGEIQLKVAATAMEYGDYATARDLYQDAILNRTIRETALLGLGRSYVALGKLSKAKAAFQKIQSSNPNYKAARDQLALLIEEKPKQTSEAVETKLLSKINSPGTRHRQVNKKSSKPGKKVSRSKKNPKEDSS